VKLLSTVGDYINASFILDPLHQNVPVFIATQGPLGSTVGDFWQMAVQQKCPVIVMLTRLMDDIQGGCAHYYPTTSNQSQVFGHLQVTTKSSNYLRDGRTIRRILEVQNMKNSDAAPHTFIHLEFRDWPDFGVPSSTAPLREMMRSLYCVPANAGPQIVHCSAGIGRTGTFCTIDHSLRRILAGDVTALDIGQTIIQFRAQRSGMVQTKEQYRFVYEVLIDELEDIVRSHRS
jgi:protein tyrosine phosphatase